MFNNILKKASESTFVAMASEALDSRPGSPAGPGAGSGARRPPGSPSTGQQQNGAGTPARKAWHQNPNPRTNSSGAPNPHSSNAQLAAQLDEAQSDIETFQKILQNAAQEKSEASMKLKQEDMTKSVDQLREEKEALSDELAEARAVIQAMRSSLEDKATDEFLSPKSAGQDSGALGSSKSGSTESSINDDLSAKTSEPTLVPPATDAPTKSPLVTGHDTSTFEERIKDLRFQLTAKSEKCQELEGVLVQRTEDLAKQKSDHDDKMKKMKAIFAAANKNLNEYRQSIAVKDEEIAELKSRLEAQQSSEETPNGQIQAVQDLEAELKSQSESAALKIQQMESKYKQANSQLEKIKVEYQQYKQRANTLLQQQRESVQTDDDSKLKELQDQLEAMSKDNRSITNDLQEAETRRLQAENELQLAMDQIANLESSHEMSRRQERQHTRQLKDLEKALKDAQREQEAAESRIASLQELREVEAQSLLQELGGNTKHTEERLAKKEEENAELHRILDRSSDDLAAAKQEIQNLRDIVSNAETKSEVATTAAIADAGVSLLNSETDQGQQQLLISTGLGPRTSFSLQDQDSPISRASSSFSLPAERPPVYSTLSDLLAAKPLVDRSPFSEPNLGLGVTASLSSAKEKEYQVKLQHLTELLNESEANHQRLLDQEKLLKEEIRNLDRAERRQNLSVDYLKNIVLKYLETTDREPLLPVLTTVLQLSPAEVASLRKKNLTSTSSLVLGGLFGGGH
ncbi:hypothetical protein BGX28_006935 [Mortierella sp. GBA30]|nr:hypothetical protein BGX28_006935 [Mortierella sp. GBA30]